MRKNMIRLAGTVLLGLGMVGATSTHQTFAAATTIADCPTTETALSNDISAAGNGGTVAFNCTNATTIPFASASGGHIFIANSSVTLDASSSAAVTLDGGGAPSGTQLFEVASGTLSLKNLTVADGYNSFAGAIWVNGGNLNVVNSTFSNNSASPGDAGAIDITGSSSTVTINNSTFSGNTSLNGSTGGAIDNFGSHLSIVDSTFSNNQAGYGGGAIHNAQGGTTTLSGRNTFANNSATGATGTPGSTNGGYGGAILGDWGPVTIGPGTDLSGNSAAELGGAIYADNLQVDGSTFSSNTAASLGGAIVDDPGATATISNSTFYHNAATCSPDPCTALGGAIVNYGTTTITTSTLADNKATTDASTLYNNGGTLNIGGSIVAAYNSGGYSGGDCLGAINDTGYNLEWTGSTDTSTGYTCGFPSDGSLHDVVGSNPLLTPLAYNGGPTPTMGVASTSAVDQIPIANSLCPYTDQRGYTRPDNLASNDGLCDIGAYETGGALPASQTSLNQVSGSATYGGTATLTATLRDSNSALLGGQKVTFEIGNTQVCDVTGQPSCPQTGTSGSSLGVATLSGVTLPSGYTNGGRYPGAVQASFATIRGYIGGSGAGDLAVGYIVHTVSTTRLAIVVQVWNASNANISASSLPVTAVCVVAFPVVPSGCGTGLVQSINKPFTFTAATKRAPAQYSYTLSSTGLTRKNSYYLLVQADGDPTLHAVQFTY